MLARIFCFLLLSLFKFITGAKTYWFGCSPENKQRIYFANHQSHGDLILIWCALPQELKQHTNPIAAKDYWTKSAFMRWVSKQVFNAVYVDRFKNDEGDPLEPLVQSLASGNSIIIFPEGYRSPTSTPQEFKSGLYNLAKQFPEVELIPIWINNLERVMPKGKYLPIPISCSAIFGAPLQLQPDEERKVFLQRARQAIIDLSLL